MTKKIRFYLGSKQENINSICQFLENVGFTSNCEWKQWSDKCLYGSPGCFVEINTEYKAFGLDNSGREWCNDKYGTFDTSEDTMLIDLLPKIDELCGPVIIVDDKVPNIHKVEGCTCSSPKLIKSIANGIVFEVCTDCKKEKI